MSGPRTTTECATFCPWLPPRQRAPVRKEKGLVPNHGNKPSKHAIFRLEAELHPELQFTRIQRAGSLAEVGTRILVVCSAARRCQDEIGAVEHVEAVGVELHVDSFRDPEG